MRSHQITVDSHRAQGGAMHVHRRLIIVTAAVLLGTGLFAAGPAARAASASVPVAGTGTATAHAVKVQSGTRPAAGAPTAPGSVLGKDGKPAGPGLTTRNASTATRPTPPSKAAQNRAAQAGKTLGNDPKFPGANQGNSSCSTCTTPYVTAAVSSTQIAETVNLSLQVFTKSGTLLCNESLTDLLGAIGGLTEPRIQYDSAAKRYSMVIASTPSTSTDVPVFFLATSQADDACGAWWIYQIVLSGSQYPLGGQLNYPYLGQDSASLLASTNNYTFGSSYLGTGAFTMPKAVAYTGNSFNVTTYSVDFSTAAATVIGSSTTTYWVAA